MFDPWQIVEASPHLRVLRQRLPDRIAGATDGGTIYLDDRLSIREQRCVLTHELVHLQMGHTECQPRPVEREVLNRTARTLITLKALQDALCWSNSLHEVAEELHVTVPVLRDRLESLAEWERGKLEWN